jgi:hypothetical protein
MSDGELLELRADFDDLTETAKVTLRQELFHRKLWSNEAAPITPEVPPQPETESKGDPPDGFAPDIQLDGETICVCDSVEQANLICYALGLQKIDAAVYRPEARYVSDQVVQDFENQPAPDDFIEPVCPKCGAPDALLESVDPVNQWLCETCGTRWQEDVREP